MRVRVLSASQPVQNALVQIKWFSQVGGLQVGTDSGYTGADGWIEFYQPVNLFGAYGEGVATKGLARQGFEVKLDGWGQAPDTYVTLSTNPFAVGSDLTKRISNASWPFIIAGAAILIALGYVLTQVRGFIPRK